MKPAPLLAALLVPALLLGCTTAAPRYLVGDAYRMGGVWSYPQESFELRETGLAVRVPGPGWNEPTAVSIPFAGTCWYPSGKVTRIRPIVASSASSTETVTIKPRSNETVFISGRTFEAWRDARTKAALRARLKRLNHLKRNSTRPL